MVCVTSHFVIPDPHCNNNLSHIVIKLPCCTLQYEICQVSLQNWVAILCNKMIISIFYLPTYLDYISTSTRRMTTMLTRLVSLGEGPSQTNLRDSFITWSGDYVTIEKRCIFTSTRLMATNLDREVASDEKMLPTKSYNSLITWTHQVTWQTKNFNLHLHENLLPLN